MNNSVIVKYLYLLLKNPDSQHKARCLGLEPVGNFNSCPYGAEISDKTSQIFPQDWTLQLHARCVYCSLIRDKERKITAFQQKEEKDPGMCQQSLGCMEPRLIGKKFCEEHTQLQADISAKASGKWPKRNHVEGRQR